MAVDTKHSIIDDLTYALGAADYPKTTEQAIELVEEAIFASDKIWDRLKRPTQKYLAEAIEAKNREPELSPMLPDNAIFSNDDITTQEAEPPENSPRNMYVKRSQMLYSTATLLQLRQEGRIKIPAIQRQTVWAKPKQQNLIVSMLRDIPIPSLLLAADPSKPNERYILDGLQRLTTMIRFRAGLLKLGDHWLELKGKKFDDLDEELQNKFLFYDFAVQDIQTERMHWPYIFRQINTGGTPVNAMETRRATFLDVSQFMRDADEFADKNKFWEALFGKNTRYKGLQAVTRAVGMHSDYLNYSKPAEQFLDRFCSQVDAQLDVRITLDRLEKTSEALFNALQKTAFKLPDNKQVNTGLVDCLIHASLLLLERFDLETSRLGEVLDQVRTQFISETDMQNAVTNNTSSKTNVVNRMKRIERIALGVAEEKGIK